MRTSPVLNSQTESQTVKVFMIKDRICASARPGQFLMLWIPGIDEIPVSIMDAKPDGTVCVAVKNVGDATRCLHEKQVGDMVGVRGPFGNSFSLKRKKVLIVGGGTGIAPLYFLVNQLKASRAKITFVMGAKTENELILRKIVEAKVGADNLLATTEDGSCGIMGLCTEPLERVLERNSFDIIYGCGPERMIQKIFELAEEYRISMEASLERLMRCAIGLCGSCTIGRYRVCADGPVFDSGQLREVEGEFAKFKRDFDGKRIRV
jgi:dihydroorotate dehydrogenase electron transfer subunit